MLFEYEITAIYSDEWRKILMKHIRKELSVYRKKDVSLAPCELLCLTQFKYCV